MKILQTGTIAVALLSSVSAHAASVYVRDINIDGLQRVERETVLSYVDIKKNTSSSDKKLGRSYPHPEAAQKRRARPARPRHNR